MLFRVIIFPSNFSQSLRVNWNRVDVQNDKNQQEHIVKAVSP
uniref:Uncharacterized protein n=1 Tax=Arundo donax TaxID=35708 RepID=A0A0A9BLD0_ARUDO